MGREGELFKLAAIHEASTTQPHDEREIKREGELERGSVVS